jgi:hypothetical protein
MSGSWRVGIAEALSQHGVPIEQLQADYDVNHVENGVLCVTECRKCRCNVRHRRFLVPAVELRKIAQRGGIEHIAYGLYRSDDIPRTAGRNSSKRCCVSETERLERGVSRHALVAEIGMELEVSGRESAVGHRYRRFPQNGFQSQS